MKYYYPSCKFKTKFMNINSEINDYLKMRGIETIGCCRKDYDQLSSDDTGITVCTNCSLILKEVSNAKIISIWEMIAQDADFNFPDLTDTDFIIQHCAKADEHLKKAVELLIAKTNASYTISAYKDYCGVNFMGHMSQMNMQIAPVTFSALEKRVVLLDEKERNKRIDEMIKSYKQCKVIVYCNSCYDILKKKHTNVVHIGELLFNQKKV